MALPTGLLVVPAAGDARLRDLVRKQRLLVLRDLLARTSDDPELKQTLPLAQQALLAVARSHSAALLDALGAPDVMPPLLAMMGGITDADAMLRVAIPSLLAALPFEGRRETRDASFPIAGLDARVSLHDTNPLAMREDHPDKQGNAVSLGDHPIEAWTAALAEAAELIRITLPTVHAELALVLRRIVPVGYEPERHLSASYREAPGLVYLTLHPSVLTLAEAIVHETQHGKLNVLSYFDPALTNGRTTWTESPVRPDLRPLSGVLLAVHAFVPVAALHARLAELDHPIARTPEFAARRAQVLAGNEHGLRVVHQLGTPTAIGAEVIAALDALHAATRAASPHALADPDALPPG